MSDTKHPLAKELATFEARRAELVGASAGKFALIHGDKIEGVFDSEMDAVRAGYATFGLSKPFLVKLIAAVDPEIRISSIVAGLCGV